MDIGFVVKKDVLEKAVSKIIALCERPAKEGKSALPHFFHIRVDGYGSSVKLSAGNSMRNVEVLITDVSAHEPFCFGVFGDYFNKILKAMPDCDLTFSLKDACYMHNGSSTLKFQYLSADQFPSGSAKPEHEWWEVDYRELFSRINRVSYCIDKAGLINLNYVKGVHISPEYFLCTDNKRMSFIPNGIIPYKNNVIVPAESFKALSALFDTEEPKGFIYTEGNYMAFSQGKTYASARLMNYDAPAFTRAIPAGPCNTCEGSRLDFLMSLKRAIIVARRGDTKTMHNPANLVFTDGKVHLSLDVEGFGITEDIAISYKGPHLYVMLDLVFLFQAIKRIACDTIRFELRGDSTPIVVTDTKGEHRNVVMPLTKRR